MAVSRYVTLRAIKHSGNDFAANTPIALSDEYAAPLLAIGAIQAQAGPLPTMPTVPGAVVREAVDTGSGGKARTYVEAVFSDQGIVCSGGKQIFTADLYPSGGDDTDAFMEALVARNYRLRLGFGTFTLRPGIKITPPAGVNVVVEGCGIGKTVINFPESYTSTLGDTGANWLTAVPGIRICVPSTVGGLPGSSRFSGMTIRRSENGDIALTQSGLAILADVAPDDERVTATSYLPQEPLNFDEVRFEGWTAAVAGNDVTSGHFKDCVWFLCRYHVVTGFNCDIWTFDNCRMGQNKSELGARPAPTLILANGYTGRGNNSYAFTISGGVGTATGANQFSAGQRVTLPVTASTGSPALTTGVRAILSSDGSSFTFDANGFTGSGTIVMGPHAASGSGNCWRFKGCWIYGLYRLAEATSGDAYIPPGMMFDSCYFEQFTKLLRAQSTFSLSFVNTYFAAASTWATLTSSGLWAADAALQHEAVFTIVTNGTVPPSTVKFTGCTGNTLADGWVSCEPNGSENSVPIVEFNDSNLYFNDAARSQYWYHIGSHANDAASVNRVLISAMYQAVINSGLTNGMFGIGRHRFRGLVKLSGSDVSVYQASSNAASNVTAIPATLSVTYPSYDLFVLEGIDKAVTVSAPIVQQRNSTNTTDFTTKYMRLNGSTRSRISAYACQRLVFVLKEDGTGGHPITWNSIYKFRSPFVQSVASTDANKSTVVEFYWDGTNWVSDAANSWVA